jgi:hypothetical protein
LQILRDWETVTAANVEQVSQDLLQATALPIRLGAPDHETVAQIRRLADVFALKLLHFRLIFQRQRLVAPGTHRLQRAIEHTPAQKPCLRLAGEISDHGSVLAPAA